MCTETDILVFFFEVELRAAAVYVDNVAHDYFMWLNRARGRYSCLAWWGLRGRYSFLSPTCHMKWWCARDCAKLFFQRASGRGKRSPFFFVLCEILDNTFGTCHFCSYVGELSETFGIFFPSYFCSFFLRVRLVIISGLCLYEVF